MKGKGEEPKKCMRGSAREKRRFKARKKPSKKENGRKMLRKVRRVEWRVDKISRQINTNRKKEKKNQTFLLPLKVKMEKQDHGGASLARASPLPPVASRTHSFPISTPK